MVVKRVPKVVQKTRPSSWVTAARSAIPREVELSTLGQKLLAKNPKIVSDFFLAKKRVTSENEVRVGSVRVSRVIGGGTTGTSFFKLRIGSHSFFVKEFVFGKTRPAFVPSYDLPVFQKKAITVAKSFIKRHKRYEKFMVADFHLAFTGRNKAYLITEFMDLIPAREHLNLQFHSPSYYSNLQSPEFKLVDRLVSDLYHVGVGDVWNNLYYSPKQKKYVLLDLRDLS